MMQIDKRTSEHSLITLPRFLTATVKINDRLFKRLEMGKENVIYEYIFQTIFPSLNRCMRTREREKSEGKEKGKGKLSFNGFLWSSTFVRDFPPCYYFQEEWERRKGQTLDKGREKQKPPATRRGKHTHTAAEVQ